jgi:hypothetical protein
MNLMASKVIQPDKDNNMKISLLLIFLFLVFVVENLIYFIYRCSIGQLKRNEL